MSRIIVLMGIDGSGKTTQGELLYYTFRKRRYKVKIIYAGNTGIRLGYKYSFYLSLPIDIITHRLLKVHEKTLLSRYNSLLKIENLLLFLNYVLLVLPKIYFYKRMSQIVIADRYVYDFILSRIALGASSRFLARILMGMTPKPDVLLLLDVSEDIAYRRKNGEKPLKELRILRRLYLSLMKRLGGYIVDASRTIPEVFDEIWRLVEPDENKNI
ncbi:MAG: dTMP kinase [Infirmifilum sp.]